MTMVWQSLKDKTDMSQAQFKCRRPTQNLQFCISCCFADDGKEMDKNEKRTCRACKAIVLAY